MRSFSLTRSSIPTLYAPECNRQLVSCLSLIASLVALLVGAIVGTIMADSAIPERPDRVQSGPPSLDEVLYMGMGTNFATMTVSDRLGWFFDLLETLC